ncbi:TetR/AcrR family transcriptional regulator [Gordonia sp. CPCC 205333]|uniref:TetR/AcrR family transcriptional regulator n=1 Tax=Gordonia sp. CPCC 205333 TaxID=3140790 RepID=UPI003AF34D1C
MSPRSSAAVAAQTRTRIVETVGYYASLQGFSQVSTREIARELEMSKSGVIGPFGSRDELLHDALEAALAAFTQAVISPAQSVPAGHPRLIAVADAWVDYLINCPFPGGCVVTAASIDLDGRPGPLKDQLAQAIHQWRAFLAEQFRAMGHRRQEALDRATMMIGVAMAANQDVQLLDDPATAARTKRTLRAVIDHRG